MTKSGLNVNEAAVVVDNHTGRVRFQCCGFGAERDATAFLRSCQGAPGANKVDCLSSASVITGEAARRAIKNGRV